MLPEGVVQPFVQSRSMFYMFHKIYDQFRRVLNGQKIPPLQLFGDGSAGGIRMIFYDHFPNRGRQRGPL